jgi:hypothetical protein
MLLLVGLAASLGACATTAPSTPAEAALQERSRRFNTTLATGAGVGAALGLGLGALVCRGNAACIAGTTVAGGGLGAGAGGYVASRNEGYADAEAGMQNLIAAAERDNARYAEDLRVLQAATAERRRSLAELQLALRQGTASRDRLRAERAALERNNALARRLASDMATNSEHLAADIAGYKGNAPGALVEQQQRLERIRAETQHEVDTMAQALGGLPPA